MGLISIPTISDGTVIDANDVNNPLNTIVNEINGNLTYDNLASNSVTTPKIADDAVTSAKIPDEAILPRHHFVEAMTLNRAGNLAVANATWATFNVTVIAVDTANSAFWNGPVDGYNKIKFPVSGWYEVDAWCVWANSGAGTLRALRFDFNGGAGDYRDISDYRYPTAFNNKNNIRLTFYATAGEYLEMYCYQNAGGALNVEYAPAYNTATKVTVRKISEQ